MTNPCLTINLDAITFNVSSVIKMCGSRGIRSDPVVKCACGDIPVARAVLDGGASALLDSRMKNIIRLRKKGLKSRMWLLRIPMLSELSLMVTCADLCLISEPETVVELEKVCSSEKRKFDVLVMTDVGDLREGLWPDRISEMAEVLRKCEWVECIGAGTNYGCFGGVMPSEENLGMLSRISMELKSSLSRKEWLTSGGGTNLFYKMISSDIAVCEVSHLRIGGALMRGRCGTEDIAGLRQDTVTLTAELAEVAAKPSKPIGPIGTDAFGHIPFFEDRGVRLRGIAAIGKQDVIPEDLRPLDEGVEVLGASSDHLVLDLEDALPRPHVGDELTFSFKRYGGLLQAFNSGYVEKIYIRD